MKRIIISTKDNNTQTPNRKGNYKLSARSWLVMSLLFFFAAGCKKVTEEAGLIGVCPKVISASPSDTATGVSLTTKINANFNEVMEETLTLHS